MFMRGIATRLNATATPSSSTTSPLAERRAKSCHDAMNCRFDSSSSVIPFRLYTPPMEKTAAALAKLVAKGGRTLPKDVGLDLGTAQPLVEQGLVEIVIEGKRRLVAITDKGREEAAKAPPP